MPKKPLTVLDLRGGRNGADPPISLPDNQAVELLNVDHFDGLLGRKRGGTVAITDSGGTAFSSVMQTLIRHIPGNDETAAELWGIDGTGLVKRMTGGTSWANVTMDDAITSHYADVVGASLNGKLFLAYTSAQDRLHCYDPNLLASVDQSHATNTGQEVLRAGAADRVKLAQSFTAGSSGSLAMIELALKRNSGVTILGGNVWITIETDNSDAPSGTQVGGSATSTNLSAVNIGTVAWNYQFYFLSRPALVSATKYWIVLQADYPQSLGSTQWGGKISSSGYASGRATEFTSAAWSATPTQNGVYDFDFATYYGTAKVRRVGIAAVATASTVADVGSGSYAAVLRYYRIRWIQMSDGKVIRRSEPSTVVSFTPSGSGASATVTFPAAPGEGETHLEVERSGDNATWYRIVGADATIYAAPEIATATTFADTTTATDMIQSPLSDVIGTYIPPTGWKFLITDGNRLLGSGSTQTGGKNSRVWFTPVLGSSDQGDDERIPNTLTQENWVDLNENDGGFLTGLGGPVNGAPFAFKYRQVWRLGPTGDVTAPYIPRKLSDLYGSLNHKSICVGKDVAGSPALYFWSPDGPCRAVVNGGTTGLQYLGRDVEDILVNLGATSVVGHSVYFPYLHQVWFWVPTGSSNSPDTKLVFDVLLGKYTEGERIRGGWYKHTSDSAAAQCSTMFSNTLGATMSHDLRPYIGLASGTVTQKCEASGHTDDAGTTFQAYIQTRPLNIGPFGAFLGVGQPTMLAKAASGVTITQSLIRDFGLETRTSTAVLTAAASETRVFVKFEGSDMAQGNFIQLKLGDASAASNAWVLDGWGGPVNTEDER